jgi:phosphohistidine phosphatase SixA/predicted NUDIX family NTP pyrophosphohydrolase
MEAAEEERARHVGVSTIVRAAGGVVTRQADGRKSEVLLIHRPAYDDWTFPKGKLKSRERDQDAALREVEEETGLRCRLDRELGVVSYRDRKGRPKIVRYWVMRPLDGRFAPNSEVDRAEWLPTTRALDTLSYEHDKVLLKMLEAEREAHRHHRPASGTRTVPLYLVRHAKAEDRESWTEPDELRPLTEEGFLQAEGLVDQVGGLPIERILSSPAVRCRETVNLLARTRGLPLELEDRLAEGTPPEQAMALLSEVASRPTVLCTHGDVLEHVLSTLVSEGVIEGRNVKMKKGSTWILETERRRTIRARYVPPGP